VPGRKEPYFDIFPNKSNFNFVIKQIFIDFFYLIFF